eukprot:scaffold1415_cov152-Skeletonema_menzelii.AAC.4
MVNEVKNMPAANSMPTQLLKSQRRQQRRRGPPGANMMPQDEPWRLSAYGRYHCLENHLGDEDIQLLEQIEQQILPLVQGFFREGGGDESCNTTSKSTTPTTNTIMDGIYRSELQLMTAVPGSGNQSWHKDNRARGLSIIVPLVDFTPENGGTQLLLGSHNNKWPVFANGGARVINAPAGSVVAYDSRTIHRGLGNETSEGRPALIFCYDRVETPPPGCGTLGSVGTSYQGRLVDILTGARNRRVLALLHLTESTICPRGSMRTESRRRKATGYNTKTAERRHLRGMYLLMDSELGVEIESNATVSFTCQVKYQRAYQIT